MTGTAVRPTYRRSKHPIGDSAPGYVLTDGQGGVAGYLFDAPPDEPGERYWHDDSAGDSEQRLRILGMLARRHGCEGVCFHRLPFTSDLAAHLWRLDCTVTMEYRNDGGYLVRIVDLASTLRAMTGELADRLAKSHLAGWRGELLVRAGDQEAVLVIEGSRVRVRRQAGRPGKAGTAHRLEGTSTLPSSWWTPIRPWRLSPRGESRSAERRGRWSKCCSRPSTRRCRMKTCRWCYAPQQRCRTPSHCRIKAQTSVMRAPTCGSPSSERA